MNKNSKNKRIFEVLWTVDAVKAFGVDNMNWG
jgi:hypothetical protein